MAILYFYDFHYEHHSQLHFHLVAIVFNKHTQALRPVILDVVKSGGKLLHLQGSNLSPDGLLLLASIADDVNKRGCQVCSVNLAGITLQRNVAPLFVSLLQLPLLAHLCLSNTKLGDSGAQLLLNLLLSLDKLAPIRSSFTNVVYNHIPLI